MRLRAPLACFAAVLALAAGACSGDGGGTSGGSDPRAWTVNLCEALSAWVRDLENRAASLEGEARKGAEKRGARGVRDALVTFTEDVVQLSARMRADLAAAGVPDVEDGAGLRRDVLTAVDELVAIFESFRAELRGLPINDRDAFLQALEDWEARGEAAFAAVERTFEEIDEKHDAPAINQALAEEEACASFREQD